MARLRISAAIKRQRKVIPGERVFGGPTRTRLISGLAVLGTATGPDLGKLLPRACQTTAVNDIEALQRDGLFERGANEQWSISFSHPLREEIIALGRAIAPSLKIRAAQGLQQPSMLGTPIWGSDDERFFRVFGKTPLRCRFLALVAACGEIDATAAAPILGSRRRSIQFIASKLDPALITRRALKQRMLYRLNQQFIGLPELTALLRRVDELTDEWFTKSARHFEFMYPTLKALRERFPPAP